jgi:hypothetical protein
MRWVALLLTVVMMLAGCAAGAGKGGATSEKPGDLAGQKPESKGPLSPADAEKVISARAKEALTALKTRDLTKLSSMIHPEKGVRFSPYAYVHTEQGGDVVLTAADFQRDLLAEKKLYTWGVQDGNGSPIQGSVGDYWSAFIYDQDFAAAPQVGYNTIIGKGNTRENSREVYPAAIEVEYHFPGFDPKYQGMDWKSLRLVFEQKGSTWYLVGIIHSQWTI